MRIYIKKRKPENVTTVFKAIIYHIFPFKNIPEKSYTDTISNTKPKYHYLKTPIILPSIFPVLS